MGVGAAREGGVQHAGKGDVVDEAPRAGQQFAVFEAFYRDAEQGFTHCAGTLPYPGSVTGCRPDQASAGALGSTTPTKVSRVTISASCASDQSSVPAGRLGSTR